MSRNLLETSVPGAGVFLLHGLQFASLSAIVVWVWEPAFRGAILCKERSRSIILEIRTIKLELIRFPQSPRRHVSTLNYAFLLTNLPPYLITAYFGWKTKNLSQCGLLEVNDNGTKEMHHHDYSKLFRQYNSKYSPSTFFKLGHVHYDYSRKRKYVKHNFWDKGGHLAQYLYHNQ